MLHAIERIAEQQPDRIAVDDRGRHVTYRELWAWVQAFSAWLTNENHMVVGIALDDSIRWIIAHFACLHAGIVQVPIPLFFTAQQRDHALKQSGATMLLASETCAEQWQPIGNDYVSVQLLLHTRALMPRGTALITYTSGSTGAPKGVCLSADGMCRVAYALVKNLGSATCMRHLSVLPLAVLLEQVGGLYSVLLTGGTYIMAGVQAQPGTLHDALRESQATSCILVPEMLKLLVQHYRAAPTTLPHLRFAAVGGARVSETLLTQAAELGLPVYQGYGLSEAASVVAVNTPTHQRPGSVGRILPHVDWTLADDGEIILHRPAMLGYVGDDVLCEHFSTGDIGTVDADGYLTITGRKKNLIITSNGRNIAPEWPESLLAAQPQIAQAMVYGDAHSSLSALLVPSSAMHADQVGKAVSQVNALLPEYARIAQWRFSEPFTTQNGMLTGNGRMKRAAILQTYLPKDSQDGFLRPAYQ